MTGGWVTPPSVTDSVEGLTLLLCETAALLLVAVAEGQIVGSVIGGWDGWRGNIYRLAVAPAYRRKGIVHRLVQEISNALYDKGAQRLSALVEHEHPWAIDFWNSLRKLGYIVSIRAGDPAMLSYIGPETRPDEVAAALNDDGAVVVEQVVPRKTVARICSELERFMPRVPVGRDSFSGFKTRRLGGLIIKSPTFASLLTRPLMLGVCDRLLEPHCSVYQLSFTQAIEIGPAEPAQTLHRDDIIYSIPPPHPEFEVLFALALTDFTDDNGATRIAIGSHRWAPGRVAHPEETVPAVMPVGSMLFYLGSTWHGGGNNHSATPRLGAFASYSLGHLRQEENQFLIAPPDVARTLPRELRGLIGYRVSTPYLGYVLEPELIELFVDWERSIEQSYQTIREIDRSINDSSTSKTN